MGNAFIPAVEKKGTNTEIGNGTLPVVPDQRFSIPKSKLMAKPPMLSFLGTNGEILKTLGISETDKIKVPQILKSLGVEETSKIKPP